jgi:hypothetical protein
VNKNACINAFGLTVASVTYHSQGTRQIKATFSGHGSFAGSTSGTLTERVTRR